MCATPNFHIMRAMLLQVMCGQGSVDAIAVSSQMNFLALSVCGVVEVFELGTLQHLYRYAAARVEACCILAPHASTASGNTFWKGFTSQRRGRLGAVSPAAGIPLQLIHIIATAHLHTAWQQSTCNVAYLHARACICRLEGHAGPVFACAFFEPHNPHWLVTAGEDRTIKVRMNTLLTLPTFMYAPSASSIVFCGNLCWCPGVWLNHCTGALSPYSRAVAHDLCMSPPMMPDALLLC